MRTNAWRNIIRHFNNTWEIKFPPISLGLREVHYDLKLWSILAIESRIKYLAILDLKGIVMVSLQVRCHFLFVLEISSFNIILKEH
ncbi:MAG: hypothetical protein WA667_28865 [Candidatus Nitrosopolaris sp.]